MSSVTKRGCKQAEDTGLRRGPWTLEEDTLLIHYIACHGDGRWNLVASCSGLKRTGKSCRLRWLNYLKPDVKHGNLTPEEQLVILELHSKWGNKWSKIAQKLPGRTDNEIKNYWRTRVQKQARQLNIDANSSMFRDVVRLFWRPRLLQKMASLSSINSLNSTPQLSLSTTEHNNTLSNSYYSEKSVSDDCSPSISSSSMGISHLPHISEFPSSPRGFGNIDLQALNLAAASTSTPCFTYPVCDFSMSDNTCDDEMVDCLWNMDELWQFRKLQRE